VGVLIAPPLAGFAKAYFDEFYLCHQPGDPREEERIEAMLHRDVDAAGRGA
jgi:hypothetical protein